MRKPIQITIPTPCHEKWEEMTPVDKGRFCASCQKDVIDFTKASDREIANAIRNNKNLCGRFSTSQLERDLIVPKEKSTVWTAIAAGVISFITLGSYKASALETVKTEQTDSKTDSIPQNTSQDKWIITGSVNDETGPLPGTSIVIKSTQTSTQTDINGNYSIEVKKGDILEFSFIGYKTKTVLVTSNNNISVLFKPEDNANVGLIVVERERSFFGRIFHSIGNLFR